MTNVNAVLFDKDGTLFDFQATWGPWAARALLALADQDRVLAREMGSTLGFDLETERFDPASSVIAGTVAEQARALLPLLPGESEKTLTTRLVDLTLEVPQVEVTPLGDFLHALRNRGLQLGVVTNDSHKAARAHLQEAGVVEIFDIIVGFDSGMGAKPDAGPLLGAAQALGVAPETVVMVGDSTHDLHAARAAGMTAVGVLTGPADEAALAPQADVVLPSIAALPDWLETR